MDAKQHERERIQPYAANPFYWQYKGRPVVLLGGSVEDNLFQIPGLQEHLDLMANVGGNYIRCTMSSRDPGDVWPFWKDPQTGRYDLERFGLQFWRRLESCAGMCLERDIIVQVELWDRFDFARGPWQDNPFNPRNNVNYTAEESGLKEVIDTHPGQKENAFFRTVPGIPGVADNPLVLKYQQKLVDRLLEVTLPLPQVLYCMDNETNEAAGWAEYWATYIRGKARAAGYGVELTEMWDAHDILADEHRRTWERGELYSFCDVSQNNHQQGQVHWDRLREFRKRIAETGRVRPINNVKIYGNNAGHFGTNRDGIERFWRNVLGGCASARFHRPDSGQGLNESAQACLRSARMVLGEIDIFRCEASNDLLEGRSANEAYCCAQPGREYAVFFCDGGDVKLKVPAGAATAPRVGWLDVMAARWEEEAEGKVQDGAVRLVTPRASGYWVAVVKQG